MVYRKGIFWVVLLLLFTLLFLWMFKNFSDKEGNIQTIRVGVSGQVNLPGVYDLYVGSDVASLILTGGGITANADLSLIDLEELVKNDSVYIIPTRVGGVKDVDALVRLTESAVLDVQASVKARVMDSVVCDISSVNVLYVGQPAVFLLISYYPELSKLYITNIPHSTLLLNSDYRLCDLYMTFGKEVFKDLIQNFFNVKIDYWIYQDRFSFVRMVDLLDGIELSLDRAFVRDHPDHKLVEGLLRVNGSTAWDFVRYIDYRLSGVKHKEGSGYIDRVTDDAFTAKAASWQVVYESRNHRHRHLLLSLAKTFNELSVNEKNRFMNRVVSVVETNITSSALLNIYLKMLTTPDLKFCSLDGYYKSDDGRLYFIPDIPSFLMLRNAELRGFVRSLNLEGGKEQVIY